MHYLAQVQRQPQSDSAVLRLLASQKAEHFWTRTKKSEAIPYAGNDFGHGQLVLVTLSSKREIEGICDATSWVLDMVQEYLSAGLTPQLLKEEVERAEQWRQSLTLRSQELGRQQIEMEARRDQIHELEINLKKEKRELEEIAAQMKTGSDRSKKNSEADTNTN